MIESHFDGSEDGVNVKNIVLRVADLLRDKRVRDIMVLDLDGLTTIADYFIICTVKSAVQTKAIVRQIEELLTGTGVKPLARNVNYDSMWVLLDYNYFIIHIFLKEGRNYYQLEKLWSDAKVVYAHEGDFL